MFSSEFFKKSFVAVSAGFDMQAKAGHSDDHLPAVWTQARNAYGQFDQIASEKNSNIDVVDVLCQLKGGKIVVRVGYDPDMKINLFWVAPSQ